MVWRVRSGSGGGDQQAPSAGLWEGQTDEAEIGVTYDSPPTEPWLPLPVKRARNHTPGYDGPRLGARCGIEHKRRAIPIVSADTVDVISR